MPRLARRNRGKSVAPLVLDLAPVTYDEQRLYWRNSLSDDIVRSLAADYLRGYEDECNADAFKEYERRFGTHGRTVAGKLKASRRARHGR